MIISHQYKFIFIKTRKTAGTSVEVALSRFCNENDIVTEIGDEQFRQQQGGQVGKTIYKDWFNYSFKDLVKLLLPNKKPDRILFKSHATASQIKHNVSRKIWNNYFKIAIERNPWDKAISKYYFSKGFSQGENSDFPSLSEYLQTSLKNPFLLSNWKIYTIKNRIAVDRVLFYETLNTDLAKLAKDIGLSDLKLPEQKLNGSYRQDKRHYREILSESDAKIIEKICQREINAFNYKF